MKELYIGLKTILRDSMSIFTKDSLTGRLSFSIVDFMFYFMLPILIFIGTLYFDTPMDTDLNKSIVGFLTVFVALSFQVIYIANDKFTSKVKSKIKEKELSESGQVELYDDEKNYLRRIGNYTRQFVRQMILLILVSVLIILCSLLYICIDSHLILVLLSAIMLPSFYIWILLLLKMVVSIYNLQMDDNKQHYKLIS